MLSHKNAALDSKGIRYPPILRVSLKHSPKTLHNSFWTGFAAQTLQRGLWSMALSVHTCWKHVWITCNYMCSNAWQQEKLDAVGNWSARCRSVHHSMCTSKLFVNVVLVIPSLTQMHFETFQRQPCVLQSWAKPESSESLSKCDGWGYRCWMACDVIGTNKYLFNGLRWIWWYKLWCASIDSSKSR